MTRPDEVRQRDAIVIGGGVAGATAALALGSATVLTKGSIGHSGSTPWAQGGIAAPMGPDDTPALHAADTLEVSGGIGDTVAVDLLTGSARQRIEWLLGLGAEFDRGPDGDLALGQEAGHGRRRILHTGGDATGAEVARTLTRALYAAPGIEVVEDAVALDLLRDRDRVVGVLVAEEGGLVAYLAPAVILATGGIGQAYRHTTNPDGVGGDGLAMAARAGARLADLEFVQFHPTALAIERDPMPLITEAVRGEGAVLVDDSGYAFMAGEHPDAELAPRDVVARAIWRRLDEGRKVFLDATTAIGAAFASRFPTVYAAAIEGGIDPSVDPMPVSPAAHYHMGGVAVDSAGRTSLDGLWACGEASSSGVHGANRLASNSLLEGLVFGAIVGRSVRQHRHRLGTVRPVVPRSALVAGLDGGGGVADRLRDLMWRQVGVARAGQGLAEARRDIDRMAAGTIDDRNALDVARLVTAAALERTESRGGHFRLDHPQQRSRWAHRSFVIPDPVETIALGGPVAVSTVAR